MDPEFSKITAAYKGAQYGGVSAVSAALSYKLGPQIGLPPEVTALAIGAVFGWLRNTLKRKAPRFFGWF